MMPTLTVGQTDQFVERGYLGGLEVFSSSEMDGLRDGYHTICGLLEPDEGPGAIREWHVFGGGRRVAQPGVGAGVVPPRQRRPRLAS